MLSKVISSTALYELGARDVKIGGPGVIFEVDEALIGKKPTYGHGKISTVFKIWVVGIRERTYGSAIPNVVLKPVPDRSKNTLMALLKEHVEE